MAGPILASRVSEAWAAAHASWTGEAADLFYREYILPMEESADRFDAACTALEERTLLLTRELSAIEADIDA